jgi:hypothetical protein
MFFQHPFEMIGMIFTNVFYSEFINNESELYWPCVMSPKAGYQFALSVSVFV